MGKAKSALESQREMLRRVMEFISDVAKEINIEGVFIVGSRARGDYLETSDIDVVIVSSDFRRMNYVERLKKLSQYRRPGIDPFPYTPEEWENPQILYLVQMKNEAKRLEDLMDTYLMY
ncbi:nucleotidyltransferase domain-containing protein [Caldivirga sp.]|uniref:nucleotidyltransferase domain-containing protein n=1 Tax=Caldivirga sp. TaxID=2080243 RepID=UPI0025BBFDA3|nr:nucleotidyltransferase domain-containing protein [Caldivirga sp.]